MRSTNYSISALEVSETAFKNPALQSHHVREKIYALKIICTLLTSVRTESSAYFIFLTGTFVADLTNTASRIALKELIAHFKTASEVENLFEGYEYASPINTTYAQISKDALQIETHLENNAITTSRKIELLPESPQEKIKLHEREKKIIEFSIKKDDLVFSTAIKSIIKELINTSLPDEFKKLAPSLLEKLTEPLSTNIQIALSVDATDTEKKSAKEAITASIKSAAHEVITHSTEIGLIKKFAAHGAVAIATGNLIAKIFELHEQKKLVTLVQEKIQAILVSTPDVAQKIRNGTSPMHTIKNIVTENYPSSQKTSSSFWSSFKTRLFKAAADRVVGTNDVDKKALVMN